MIKRIIAITFDRELHKADMEYLVEIILYSLLVSYGIRVDTILLVVTKDKAYIVDGYSLRHLYPQKKSLEGFVDSIFFKRSRQPGVRIYYRTFLRFMPVLKCGQLAITTFSSSSGIGSLNNLLSQIRDSIRSCDCILIPLCECTEAIEEILGFINYNSIKHVNMPVDNMNDHIYLVTITHYLLDISIGAWIRRKGRIIYVGSRDQGWRQSTH